MRFVDFCSQVLRLDLTQHQRVLCLVGIDGIQPEQLDDGDRAIARMLFGDIDAIAPHVRRIQAWRLGRGSGKTTIAAALAVYLAVTADISACGPGDEPAVVTIAPRVKTATLSVRMARELSRRAPSVERLIVKNDDGKDGFAIQRKDGRRVRIAAYPASRGGAAARGLSIVGFVLDEAEFFTSGSDFSVTDRDCYTALIPRLIRGGLGILISTPWPVETLMSELVDRNFANPSTALVAIGPTLTMRDDDPDLAVDIERERLRDPETAAREFDCVSDASGSTGFFDPTSVDAAVDHDLVLPLVRTDDDARGFAMDLALVRDSAACVGVARRGERYVMVALEELRPKKGAPLKLSSVIATFADLVRPFGVTEIAADPWAREPAREYTEALGLAIVDAPAGQAGKADTFIAARKFLREGRACFPNVPRFVAQMKSVLVKPQPGGGIQISQPRRAGLAHGDIVSAWVLALHQVEDGGLDYAAAMKGLAGF